MRRIADNSGQKMPVLSTGGASNVALPSDCSSEQSATLEDRMAPRRLERIRGMLSFGDARSRVDCRIINMSATGACIELAADAKQLAHLNRYKQIALILTADRSFIECVVVWTNDRRVGLHFTGAFLRTLSRDSRF